MILQELLALSHEIGREDRGLAILGEGNTSARLGEETFLVQACGTRIGTLKPDEVVECRFSILHPLLEASSLTDPQVEDALLASRVDSKARKPPVEAVFHAYLLSLPGIKFVGHSHATAVNQILCSPRAQEFAGHRMFPQQIAWCGIASAFVACTDPGLPLSQAIRRQTEAFVQRHQRLPRVILLQNHGLITLGATAESVLSATLMAEKTANHFVGAATLGGPVFYSKDKIRRLDGYKAQANRPHL